MVEGEIGGETCQEAIDTLANTITLDTGSHINRDRARPLDPAPPTPPGIRITYHGGSVEMIP
jgi:hypothetical protein